jgi:hypothetical protein
MRILIFLLLSVFMLSGCQTNNSKTGSNQNNLSNFFTEDDISIKINGQYESSESVILNINNIGSSTLTYGSRYNIEEFRDGQWVELPFIKDLAWTSNSVILSPNDNHNSSIFFKSIDANIKQGHLYRIIKIFRTEDNREITLAAEFKVANE